MSGKANPPTDPDAAGVVKQRPPKTVLLRVESDEYIRRPYLYESSLSNTPASQLSERLGNNTTLLKDLRGYSLGSPADLPVFLIQTHGDTTVNIALNRRRRTDDKSVGTVEHKRGADEFIKVARSKKGHVEWIIQPAPIGKVAVCSAAEDRFADNIGRNLIKVRKDQILSARPETLFDIADSDTGQRAHGSPSFIPPTGVYFDKNHSPYDGAATYDWSMLILPIFQPTSISEVEKVLDFKFFYRTHQFDNAKYDGDSGETLRKQEETIQNQMRDRIKNREILECNAFWKRGSENPFWPTDGNGQKIQVQGQIPSQEFINKLRKRYEEITLIWEEALPEVVGIEEGTNEGIFSGKDMKGRPLKDIKLSKIMDTLGSGIYLSLTCSPLTNLRYKGKRRPPGADRSIARQAGQEAANEANERGLERWKRIFSESRNEPRGQTPRTTPLKIGEDYADSDALTYLRSGRLQPHEEGSLSEGTLADDMLAKARKALTKRHGGGARTRRRRRPRKTTKKKALRKRHHRTRHRRRKRRRRRRTRRAGNSTRCRLKAKEILNRFLPRRFRLNTEKDALILEVARDLKLTRKEARELITALLEEDSRN